MKIGVFDLKYKEKKPMGRPRTREPSQLLEDMNNKGKSLQEMIMGGMIRFTDWPVKRCKDCRRK
jgi:hypothetical protein